MRLLPTGARAWLRWLGPPLLLFGLARALLGVGAAASAPAQPEPHPLHRWDSSHYVAIAADGYELFSCREVPGYDPEQWCGNAGWLPGFPLLLTTVHALTGISYVTLGATLSGLFFLLTLCTLWGGYLEQDLSLRGWSALALAAWFPGSVYYSAIFPVSMFLFFALLTILAVQQDALARAAACGAVAAITYSSGLLLAPVIGLWMLVEGREQGRPDVARRVLIVPGSVVAAYVVMLCYFQYAVGAWDAFFLTQAKYGHGWHSPLTTWWSLASGVTRSVAAYNAIASQTLLVTVLVGLAVVPVAGRPWRRASPESLLALWTVVYWVGPLVAGSAVSMYRAESLLLPLVPLLHQRAPRPVLVLLAAAAIIIALGMNQLFFESRLV